MKIIKVTSDNIQIYNNLAQAYEAEFSPITNKLPKQDGVFELDTPVDESHIGYIGYDGEKIVGIANIGYSGKKRYEVCEFYIIPIHRKKSYGTKFINKIWSKHAGKWVIKQIAGAEYATVFWRKAIASYGVTIVEEGEYLDPYWGLVTRQMFEIQ